MKRLHVRLLSILLIFCFSETSHAETQHLVLVTGTQQLGHAILSQREVRKIFLGQGLHKFDYTIIALINNTDALLYQVFLQKVVYMSENAYEQHLLGRVFRMGGTRPPTYMNISSLVNALREKPGTITYMWEKTAQETPGIIIIGKL